MRLVRIALALAVVLTVLAAPASAAPGPGDRVGGVGIRLSDARVQYTVSVQETPSGTTGSFLYRNLDFRLTFGGPATCIEVDGNQAVIGGWITHAVGADLLGQAYLVFIEDNGPTGDLVSQTYILPADAELIDADLDDFPSSCPDATVARFDDPFEVVGDFVVLDR